MWRISSKKSNKGFTLLELLIVIAIIAILAVILVLVLNPSETLKKSRDAQRISDLNTLKTALGLYLTTATSPDLDGSAGTFLCLTGTASTAKIAYSSEVATPTCTTDPTEGSDTGADFAANPCYTVGTTGAAAVDGTGWVPVNLLGLTGGSPISNLPLDPVNTSIDETPSSADYVYRYACQSTGDTGKPSNVFELNAVLESVAYTSDDNRMSKDGGDNTAYYEVGTSLHLLGAGTAY